MNGTIYTWEGGWSVVSTGGWSLTKRSLRRCGTWITPVSQWRCALTSTTRSISGTRNVPRSANTHAGCFIEYCEQTGKKQQLNMFDNVQLMNATLLLCRGSRKKCYNRLYTSQISWRKMCPDRILCLACWASVLL